MAELLKVTTPIINKNQPVQQPAQTQAPGVLNIQDASRVLQTHNQTNMMNDGNATLENSSAPAMLLNLLKDPAVAASYLKNISFLEEIFKLLPANNQSMTAEIEQLFGSMMMPEAEIAPEMMRQGETATLLRGELFDFLRDINSNAAPRSDLQAAVANFLKAANSLLCREDIRGAVYNNLQFLRKSLSSSRELSSKIDQLLTKIALGGDKEFPQTKSEVLSFLNEVTTSILYTEKLDKVLSILKYNLSRYNANEDYFHEAAFLLRQHLTAPQRRRFSALAEQFLSQLAQQKNHPELKFGSSRVMDTLALLLSRHSSNESLSAGDEARIEQILHSLLSSPCNFTPLLHFIIPVEYQDMRSFAEIWINPESDEKDMPKGAGKGVHFLLVIDAEGVGRFEADVYIHERTVDFNLLCPPGLESFFSTLSTPLSQTFASMDYRVGSIQFAPLERPRSLMEVFKSLPYKRMGLDVKV